MTRRRFVTTTAAVVASAPFVSRAGAANAAFSIGLVADAQYADVAPKGTRYYRHALPRLEAAIEHFNQRDLAFSVHLGDLIDRDWRSYERIIPPFGRSRRRWHHLLGNHDFEVLDAHKARVPQRLGMKWRYGTFDHGMFRFVILDTNDVSTYACADGSMEQASAANELARLAAAKVPQAKPWNGGIGRDQLEWLGRVLAETAASQRKAIVLAHQPVWPIGHHLVWNAADVLAVVDGHPGVVAAWINGHNHAGAFAERNGVPYLTMRGMVETPDTSAFATAEILADRILITGHGREPSRELVFAKA